MYQTETDIVILGAGLTGLTSAYYLKKANKNFKIVEPMNRAGGVIHTQKVDEFILEEGPNTGVIGNTSVVEMFEELASKFSLQYITASENVKKRYILKDGSWHSVPLSLMEGIQTPLFSWRDKLNLLIEPFRPAGKNPHENLSSFVKRRMGESFLNYAIDPFIGGVYAGNPDFLIPKYALPKLYNLEQKYGSLIGGSICKGIFEKKTELEKRISKKTFSFPNGLSDLSQCLEAYVGNENFCFSAQNIVVSKLSNGYVVSYDDAQGHSCQIFANKLITTFGSKNIENVFPFINSQLLNKVDNLQYSKVIEVAIGFKKWNGIKLDGFGGLVPFVENRNILGVLYLSSLFPNRAPEGGALLSVFLGGARRSEIIELSDSEIFKLIETEFLDIMQLKNFEPEVFKIFRHHHAIPQYGIETAVRLEAVRQIENENPGLFIAGNLKDGIGMADRIQQAKLLIDRLS